MKKNMIITFLCVIVAIVLCITVALFIKAFNKQTTDDGDGQPEISQPTDTTQTPDPQPDPQPEPIPEPQPPENNADTDNEQNSNPDESVSNNNETTDNSDNQSHETSQPGNPGAAETTPTIVPETVSGSYKDFSLTKGMDAKAAYDYLNSFLTSKYSILTNKQNKVSSDFAPTNLVVPAGCQYQMESTAANALVSLLSAAKQNGIYDLVLYSGYRTYASQKNKYETRTNKYLSQGYSQAEAEAKAGEYIAPPGASEHHTGLAADVCSSSIVNKYGYLSDEFDTTKSYQWMKNNCANYGFIVRYQKGKESITGYSYEPWHIRYIGKDHATACTALGITYEEYYSLLIKYRDQAKADAGV